MNSSARRPLQDDDDALPRIARPAPGRAARGAAERRRARSRAIRHRGLSRLFIVLTLCTLVISGYLGLLGNVMWMQLQLDRERDARDKLRMSMVDIDDRLAHVQSRENLMRAARALGMHDPSSVSLVTLPKPPPDQPKASGLAFFGSWIH